MATNEIICALRHKRDHCQEACAIRHALIYLLYENGYSRKYISDAVNAHNTRYSYLRAVDGIDVNDELIKCYVEEIKKHNIELVPHFERMNNQYYVRARISIDGIIVEL